MIIKKRSEIMNEASTKENLTVDTQLKEEKIDLFDLDNIDFTQREERRRGDRRRGWRKGHGVIGDGRDVLERLAVNVEGAELDVDRLPVLRGRIRIFEYPPIEPNEGRARRVGGWRRSHQAPAQERPEGVMVRRGQRRGLIADQFGVDEAKGRGGVCVSGRRRVQRPERSSQIDAEARGRVRIRDRAQGACQRAITSRGVDRSLILIVHAVR